MDGMRIAGRCYCGFVLEWVDRNPDAHLHCFGLRWCGRCSEAAIYRGKCPACRRVVGRAYQKRQRDGNTVVYQRQKEAKRLRYRTNPAFAAACRAKHYAYMARRRVAA